MPWKRGHIRRTAGANFMQLGSGHQRARSVRSWRFPSIGFVIIIAASSLAISQSGAGSTGANPGVNLSTHGTVGAVAHPGGGGWAVAADGAVTPFNGAPTYPDVRNLSLTRPIVGMAPTPDGAGYWLVASDGGVFASGDAGFFGSTGSLNLNKPIVGMAATPDGRGYWLVSSDGGVFAFGDAGFFGSTGNLTLNRPIVAIAVTPDGRGYWLVASDGGIFAIGDAHFYGSAAELHLLYPIVSMARTTDGAGYWLVASDGGVFAVGDAKFYGSMGDHLGFQGASIVPVGTGYYLVSTGGMWLPFGAVSPVKSVIDATTTTTSTSTTVPPTTTTTTTTTTLPPPTTTPGTALQVSGNQLLNSTGQPIRLLGVDASGTEDACTMGHQLAWGPSNSTEAAGIASWDTNAVRVPLNEDCWLGINGIPTALSGSAYIAFIKSWVASLNAAGLVAILDLHWSAPGTTEAVKQWEMPDADHSITFWSQVAATFKSDPLVVFDLFNEPHLGGWNPTAANWNCWRNGCTTSTEGTYNVAGMQQMLDAVRGVGANQPVMVGGLNWAGDPCGVRDTDNKGGSCMWLTNEPTDPVHQLIASFHTYNWTACTTTACWNSSVGTVAAQVPVVTGEFGEADCSSNYVNQYM